MIFGKRSETAEIPQIGKAFFSNAEFPATDYDAIINANAQNYLFEAVASTAIGDNGIAVNHSLRKTQVTLPCTLEGQILNIPEEDDKTKKLFEDSLSFIKRIGENRNRGLGRCKFTIKSI